MTYRLNTNSVASETRRFSGDVQKYWSVCLAEITSNPFPRFGTYIEKIAPIRGLPMRTYLYEITPEVSISGEILYVFTAEFFPWYLPVYVVNGDANQVAVIYLRENHLV